MGNSKICNVLLAFETGSYINENILIRPMITFLLCPGSSAGLLIYSTCYLSCHQNTDINQIVQSERKLLRFFSVFSSLAVLRFVCCHTIAF